MTTAQLQAAALPRSKAPLFVLGGLLITLAALAGGYLLTHRSSATEAAPVAVVEKALPPVAESPKGEPPPPEEPKNEPPKNEPPVIVPPVAETVKAAPGDTVDAKKMAELFVDGDKTYVRAGQGDALVVGSTLVIVGAPGSDGKRQQLGTGTVMEVFPKMARVALDEAAAGAQGPRFAALGDVKVTAPPPAPGVAGSVEVKKAVEIFKDGDKTYARAGQPDGLVVGQTLVVVSGAGSDGRRTKLGTGTVMEVFPKLARLALDEKAAGASGDRFAALGEVKEVVAPSTALTVKKTAALFADGDKTYVRAGKAEGLVVGQELTIVGAAQADGKYQKLGTATVMEVQGKIARLLLDPEVTKASGTRLAALDASTGTPAAPGSGTSPAPTTKSGMAGALKLQQQPVWAVFLENKSKFEWHACTLVAPGQRRMAFPSLIPGARREFAINAFVFDPTVQSLANEVQVTCKEGTIRIPAQ